MFSHSMRAVRGGWVYMMADRYRGAIYVGVTAYLPARIRQHQFGAGSDHCAHYGLHRLVWAEAGDTIAECIAHEKRLKRWHRDWKFALTQGCAGAGVPCRPYSVCGPQVLRATSRPLRQLPAAAQSRLGALALCSRHRLACSRCGS